MDLDHVAIALADVREALGSLVGELGATVLHGGESIGFRSMQLRMGADGMTVELLEPWRTSDNDFLARFLERHGDGPHHITFKTDDIRGELERAEGLGFHPVGIDLTNPWWMEAFLLPKEAGGTVVQLAQSDPGPVAIEALQESGEEAAWDRRWWPEPPAPAERPAILRRVVLNTTALSEAERTFGGFLGGTPTDADHGGIEFTWPSGGRLVFDEAPDVPPGVNRFEGEHDGELSDRMIGGTRFRLSPAD